MSTQFLDPIRAVTHPDPYPYYAELLQTQPIYYDHSLKLWVAASAESVNAVLSHEQCRVRPPNAPVPPHLLDSPAGELFRHLVRQIDGDGQRALKQTVGATLATIDSSRLAIECQRWCDECRNKEVSPSSLRDYAFQVPLLTVASLIGVSSQHIKQVTSWVDAYVCCLSPASSPEQIAQGNQAASRLVQMMQKLPASDIGLVATMKRVATYEISPVTLCANIIGFLSQTYEATAGLIGNSLLMYARQPDLRQQIDSAPELLLNLVTEVVRYDPPVQNTRRWLAQNATIVGHEMQKGDAILVLLAAANRDPALNPHPNRVDLFRQAPRHFTFGLGAHACLGAQIATTIAGTALSHLLQSGYDISSLAQPITYRPSHNGRIPLL